VDVVAAASELVAAGHPVALVHAPGADPAGELSALVETVAGAGLAGDCRLTVPVEPLGEAEAAAVARRAREAGLGVDVAGPSDQVLAPVGRLPGAGAVVAAAAPGAEEACRALPGGEVRLLGGRGHGGDLAFVRCLNVLMAGSGRPGVAARDARLDAIAGERAAWNERQPESWEYVMSQGVRVEEQRRLLAGGYTVRVLVRSGARR
jgi:hypothetical protein